MNTELGAAAWEAKADRTSSLDTAKTQGRGPWGHLSPRARQRAACFNFCLEPNGGNEDDDD
jgi:hypothetical protein